ncbi:MAG: D-2-hydroxyacid dehydrogenase [Bifidobacteriaceae bacterium]|nr:D-2-hydroxyacid dehydrogenase [Bifidobacteriaceae bacterium]
MARTTRLISGLALPDNVKRQISELGAELILDDAASDEATAVALAPQADVWFGPGLTPEVFAQAAKLVWFQTASVGIEYFMFPELRDSNVTVTNMRGRHTAVSEHAFAFILALARVIPKQVRQQNDGVWQIPDPSEMVPLYGSEMVVFGTGQIGKQIADRANAFRIRVEGVNHFGIETEGFERVYRADQLAQSVQGKDWVVNAMPLTDDTRGAISAEVIGAMKPGAYFINIGRGKSVDQDALLDALQSKRLRGAGLDVFQAEPLPANHPFWSMDNVLITPHSAGVIPGYSVLELGTACLLRNLALFQAGQPLFEPVDKKRGY